MHDGVTAAAPRATRREWIGLGVIALPCVLYSMDLTVLNLAVPQLAADLEPTAAQMLWIVDIYGFLLAGSLLTMGTLGDRIGRRRLLLIGAAAFGATSVVAAFAPSAETLIAARGLLGIAGATLAPSTLSLIRNMFLDGRERTFAIGVWIASFSAGGAIGPVVGGVLLSHFWWGSVFLLAVPVMALLLVVGPPLLPEFRDPRAGRLDIPSAALSVIAVLAVIYGMKRIAEQGAGPLPLAAILAGLAVGLVFVWRQLRLADPLIDLKLFATPAFAAALGINVLSLFIAFGSFLYVAQFFQLVLGMTPLEAGLWTAPTGIVFVLGSMLAPASARRFHPAQVIAASFLVTMAGFLLLTQIGGASPLPVLMAGLLLMCLGLAPIGTLTTDLVVSSAPPERAGAASAISETSFELGGALGIAVLGSVITAVYRGGMAEVAPSGVAGEVVERARQTMGGALAAARDAGPAGAELLAAAQRIFTDAVVLTAAICAAGAALAAVLALLLLRDAPTAPAQPAAQPGE